MVVLHRGPYFVLRALSNAFRHICRTPWIRQERAILNPKLKVVLRTVASCIIFRDFSVGGHAVLGRNSAVSQHFFLLWLGRRIS